VGTFRSSAHPLSGSRKRRKKGTPFDHHLAPLSWRCDAREASTSPTTAAFKPASAKSVNRRQHRFSIKTLCTYVLTCEQPSSPIPLQANTPNSNSFAQNRFHSVYNGHPGLGGQRRHHWMEQQRLYRVRRPRRSLRWKVHRLPGT
jgi:hypothetical protein